MRPTSGEAPHRCARYLRLVGIGIDVRSWHEADINVDASMTALGGKPDIDVAADVAATRVCD